MGLFSQIGSPLKVHTPLPENTLLATHLEGWERLGGSFEFSLSLRATRGTAIRFDSLVGQTAYATIEQQGHDKRSPHEIKKGYLPDPEVLFIHVFGCPVQYEPHGGALHKRGRKTEWGYFVGVQWPMVLILRPEDGKNYVSFKEEGVVSRGNLRYL